MDDAADIRALLDRHRGAIRTRDAAAVIACFAPDIVAYDLAPPLRLGPEVVRDPAGLQAWFDTWAGPISSVPNDLTVVASGDLANAFALCRMQGEKSSGETVDLWFRFTACFARRDGAWLITHLHESVPFAMDGSDRALLDLKPT